MPKLPDRHDSRVKVELSPRWLIGHFIVAMSATDARGLGPCASCGSAVKIGERASRVALESDPLLPVATLCEACTDALDRIHAEEPERVEDDPWNDPHRPWGPGDGGPA